MEQLRRSIEKLRAILADATQYVENASPRERRLLLFAGAGGVVFVLLLLWVGFGSSISRHQDSLEEKRGAVVIRFCWAVSRSCAS